MAMPGIVLRIGANTRDAVQGINQIEGKLGKFGQAAKGALAGIAAGIGIGTVVDKLGDMAQAAIEDQRSVTALKKALDNVGLGRAADQAEEFIRTLMLATGVADDDLRPALQQAATATGNLELSQRMLADAVDISKATGKDLDSVMTALTKASLGNLGALTKLGIPLDQNTIKSRDFGKALDSLEQKFKGQAAEAADDWAGKLERINTAAGEAQETIGYSLLNAVDDLSDSLGGTDGAVSGITALGDGIAGIIDQSAQGVAAIKAIIDAIKDQTGASENGSIQQEIWNKSVEVGSNVAKNIVGGPLYLLGGAYEKLQENVDRLTGKTDQANSATGSFHQSLLDAASALGRTDDAADSAGGSIDEIGSSAGAATRQVQSLSAALDDLTSEAQSLFDARVNLEGLLGEDPAKTPIGIKQQASALASAFKDTASKLKDPAKQYALLLEGQAKVSALLGQNPNIKHPNALAKKLVGASAVYGSYDEAGRLGHQSRSVATGSKTNVDPARTRTREKDTTWRADARTAQRGARTRTR